MVLFVILICISMAIRKKKKKWRLNSTLNEYDIQMTSKASNNF